jgi:uncharacterized protein YndB with AHSA1/START domain
MEQLHFTIRINAPKQKVWDTMLGKKTYSEWTAPFGGGEADSSTFEGTWEKGSKMRFVGADDKGNVGGIESIVAENKPYEFISLEHVAHIENGKVSDKEEYKAWTGAHENYTFREVDGMTEVQVDTDSDEESKEQFRDQWHQALQKLKELSEKN